MTPSRAHAAAANVGTVIGGGLLGLEAANALRNLGLETHVVEFAPRLMPLQVDDLGGAILRRRIEGLGVAVHTGMSSKEVVGARGTGVAAAAASPTAAQLETDLVVFSAGIRAARRAGRAAAGLAIGQRGGLVIDDRCRTSDPDVYAIGECASYDGRTYGLVAPGYRMAEAAAATCSAAATPLPHAFDMSTKLKLLGVDVASFGDAFALDAGRAHAQPRRHRHRRLQEAGGQRRPAPAAGRHPGRRRRELRPAAPDLAQNKIALPPHPEDLILPPGRDGRKPAGLGVDGLPDAALICSCHNVAKGAICAAIGDEKLTAVAGIKSCTKAGTGCGSCVTLLSDLLKAELKRAGVAVTNHLCEHFAHSRQELLSPGARAPAAHLRRGDRARTAAAAGCEICKPAVASILASTWNEYIRQGRARRAAGHQRPLPGQHAARRHLLGGAARAGRRDHPRPADRARRGGQALRAVHQDHRRPAGGPVRRAGRPAARTSGAS